jgi:flavin reductase
LSEKIEAAFRRAMRRLASTVTIVTTADGAIWRGMTATSVTAVSVQPPALLVCINRAAALHDTLISSRRFCINLLRAGQGELCRIFSGQRRVADRFGFGDWQIGDWGIPYLVDAQASLLCSLDLQLSYATHSLCIGLVEGVKISDEVAPLIYQDGGFLRPTQTIPASDEELPN